MEQILTILGYVGIVSGLIISGIFNSRDRKRAYFSNESLSQKEKRFNISLIPIILGIISFGLKYLLFV